jgi:hypothetical protein
MDNTIVNAVQAALEGNAAEYQAAVEAALNAKAEAAIEERKKEIAQNLIAQPEDA